MRRPLRLLVMTATVLVLGALTAISTAAVSRPSLVVVKRQPLTVQGRHLKPHAHVRVTLTSSGQTTRRVTVGRSGRFTVTFTQTLDRCTQWTVRVTQSGRAAVIVRGPNPQCTPAGSY